MVRAAGKLGRAHQMEVCAALENAEPSSRRALLKGSLTAVRVSILKKKTKGVFAYRDVSLKMVKYERALRSSVLQDLFLTLVAVRRRKGNRKHAPPYRFLRMKPCTNVM